VDRRLARLAEAQHAVVTTAHLFALGMGHDAIEYRLRVGRLHPLHRGVYAIGHPDITLHGRFLAAVLAVGADAVLSHRIAAVLHGFAPKAWAADATIHVAVPRRLRQRAGLRVHSLSALDRRDWTRRHRIAVTTAARTLLDLARTESDRTLKRLLGQAQVERRVSVPQLRAEAAATKGRGATRILALTAAGPAPTRCGLEDRFLERCHGRGLRPRTNARVEGVEVDFLFEQHRLIVETDGGPYHASSQQQEADPAKQAMLEAAGYRVLRIVDHEIDGAQTIQRVEAAIITRS
jgi:very-short-patch-repair endonuclease